MRNLFVQSPLKSIAGIYTAAGFYPVVVLATTNPDLETNHRAGRIVKSKILTPIIYKRNLIIIDRRAVR